MTLFGLFIIFVPLLAGVACIWVSHRNPGGWMGNLRLLGVVLIVYGLVFLGEALGLFGGEITIPAD